MSHASLCFLSYNRPDFIVRAIRSAVENAGEPVEVIVHDDGSSDPEVRPALLSLVDRGYISTLLVNHQGVNQGQGVALNRMFGMATGDPIIKLDHDLTFAENWVSKMNRILEDERVGLLGLFKYEYDPVDWRKTIITDVALDEMGWEHPLGYSFHPAICGSGFALPRRVWDLLGPFEEHSDSFAEDAMMQAWVSETPGMYCALPDEDLIFNHGFGVGPSTVVAGWDHETNEGIVQKIHHGPYLAERQPAPQISFVR